MISSPLTLELTTCSRHLTRLSPGEHPVLSTVHTWLFFLTLSLPTPAKAASRFHPRSQAHLRTLFVTHIPPQGDLGWSKYNSHLCPVEVFP